jgi:hypothetical protein
MAKHWKTFEECHVRALKAAHDMLWDRLADDYYGIQEESFFLALERYFKEMGYAGEEDDDSFDSKFLSALKRAWSRELREKRERINIADTLDCCIREIVIAIGERWPDEAKPKLTAVPKKKRAA